MTQRIFDTDNEKDMADLWDILPEGIERITQTTPEYNTLWSKRGIDYACIKAGIILINWHLKTEITRPIKEATEDDKGRLCKFWRGNEACCHYGILFGIDKDCSNGKFMMSYSDKYSHCRRLTKQEIEELI